MLRNIAFGNTQVGAILADLLNDIDSSRVTRKVSKYFNYYQKNINELVMSYNTKVMSRQTFVKLLELLRNDMVNTIGKFGTMNIARSDYEEPSANPFIETALRNVLTARFRLALGVVNDDI